MTRYWQKKPRRNISTVVVQCVTTPTSVTPTRPATAAPPRAKIVSFYDSVIFDTNGAPYIYLSFDNYLVPGGGKFDTRTNARVRVVYRLFCSFYCPSVLLVLENNSCRTLLCLPTTFVLSRLCYLLDCRTRLCLWLGLNSQAWPDSSLAVDAMGRATPD